MRIYYFGELIEENGRKVTEQKTEILEQTELQLNRVGASKKTSMESIGDLLRDIDMKLDVYRPNLNSDRRMMV